MAICQGWGRRSHGGAYSHRRQKTSCDSVPVWNHSPWIELGANPPPFPCEDMCLRAPIDPCCPRSREVQLRIDDIHVFDEGKSSISLHSGKGISSPSPEMCPQLWLLLGLHGDKRRNHMPESPSRSVPHWTLDT